MSHHWPSDKRKLNRNQAIAAGATVASTLASSAIDPLHYITSIGGGLAFAWNHYRLSQALDDDIITWPDEVGTDFAEYFKTWYSRPGHHAVHCSDLHWLETPELAPVVSALESLGRNLEIYLRDETGVVVPRLLAAGAQVSRLRQNTTTNLKFSYIRDNDLREAIIRIKSIERLSATSPQVKFSRSRDPYLTSFIDDFFALQQSNVDGLTVDNLTEFVAQSAIPTVADANTLAKYWDENVSARYGELYDGTDSAYSDLVLLIKNVLNRLPFSRARVLDVGCGLGFLSSELAKTGHRVIGIDPSGASIAGARSRETTIGFEQLSVESYAAANAPSIQPFDAVVANMTLNAVPNLDTFLAAAHSVLKPGGFFIATLPHPAFYLPGKRGLRVDDYDYTSEGKWLIQFRIANHDPHPSPVPYFHRPIERYSSALESSGFKDFRIQEPDWIGRTRKNDILLIMSRRDR